MNSLKEIIQQNLSYNYCILTLSHSDYRTAIGGTEKVIRNEADFFIQRKIHYIQIFPQKRINQKFKFQKFDQIVGLNIDGQNLGSYHIDYVLFSLYEIQKGNKDFIFLSLHIHHLIGFSLTCVKLLLDILTFQHLFYYIHDYYSVCPQHNLMINDTIYCRLSCQKDDYPIDCRYFKKHTDQVNLFRDIFNNYPFSFIAPSETARNIWCSVYPEFSSKVTIYPHLRLLIEQVPLDKNQIHHSGTINIAYIGYESMIKGYDIWVKFVNTFSNSYLKFFHIGAVSTPPSQVTYIPVEMEKSGGNRVSLILKENDIQFAFLFSICPETFSFTLYESLVGGAFILTHIDSGNIAAVVNKRDCGLIFQSEMDLFAFFHDEKKVRELIQLNRQKMHKYCTEFDNSRLNSELINKGKTREISNFCNPTENSEFNFFSPFENIFSNKLIILINYYDDLSEKTIFLFKKMTPLSVGSILSRCIGIEIKLLNTLIFSIIPSAKSPMLFKLEFDQGSLSDLKWIKKSPGKKLLLILLRTHNIILFSILNNIEMIDDKISTAVLFPLKISIHGFNLVFSVIRSRKRNMVWKMIYNDRIYNCSK